MNVAGQFPPYRSAGEDDSPSASMLHIRDFLSRQWRLVALVTGLAIVVGTIYVAISPSRYTAQADMIIDTKKVTWTQSELSSENRTVEDASVESEIETTKSRVVHLEQIAATNTEGRIRTEAELQELREGQSEIKVLIQAHDDASRKLGAKK